MPGLARTWDVLSITWAKRLQHAESDPTVPSFATKFDLWGDVSNGRFLETNLSNDLRFMSKQIVTYPLS